MEPTIYLFFNGTCLEAMTHYADVLGGEVGDVMRNGDAPDAESRMPGGDDLVMNMAITLGGKLVMASDVPQGHETSPRGYAVSIDPPSLEEFDRIYAALAEDARSVEMAPDETFWADRFAMFQDRFGTAWMLNYTGSKA